MEVKTMKRMNRKEFLIWYRQTVNGEETPIQTREATFKFCKHKLLAYGKGHEDIWLNDYLIWKLRQ